MCLPIKVNHSGISIKYWTTSFEKNQRTHLNIVSTKIQEQNHVCQKYNWKILTYQPSYWSLVLNLVLWSGQVERSGAVRGARSLPRSVTVLLDLLSRMKSDTVESSAWRGGRRRCSVIPDVSTPARPPRHRHPAAPVSGAEAFFKSLSCSSNVPNKGYCLSRPTYSKQGGGPVINKSSLSGPSVPSNAAFSGRKEQNWNRHVCTVRPGGDADGEKRAQRGRKEKRGCSIQV